MKTVKIQAEIPEYLRSAIAQLPDRAGRSESEVIADALREYVDSHVPQLRDLKEAVAAADAGEFASDEEVAQFFARHGARSGQ